MPSINQNKNQTEHKKNQKNVLDYINEVLNETVEDDDKQDLPDDWQEGLTFTARSSREYTKSSLDFISKPGN